MCKFPQYYPDENQYEPCQECEDCTGVSNYDQNIAFEYLYKLDQLKEVFKVSELNPNHGKHNVVSDDEDDLPF
jgi:hypothetical protein